MLAIAEYERRLIALNSEFDLAMRGENSYHPERFPDSTSSLARPLRQLSLRSAFQRNCSTRLLGIKAEVLNVPTTSDPAHAPDPDPGRAGFLDLKGFKGAFKTPTYATSP